MRTLPSLLWLLGAMLVFSIQSVAQDSPVVVFAEPGFPAADSAGASSPPQPPSPQLSLQQLRALFPDARLASADQLPALLSSAATRLLVLPYGSVFPEPLWSGIHNYLERGGNLLVLGGEPFTRAAFRDGAGWHLRDYSTRFARELGIDQYQATPGSDG